jgi:hypothetical protein
VEIAPLKMFPCWKTPVNWCGIISSDGPPDLGGGTGLCVVYGKDRSTCEDRMKVVFEALVHHEARMDAIKPPTEAEGNGDE